MADTKISGLTAAASFIMTDELPVNESGTSKKVTGAQIFTEPVYTAGDATHAAFTLTSGAVQTSPTAGDVEYDGTCFYTTPVASARGVSPSMMFAITAAGDVALATSITEQAAFTSTNDVWTLASATTYMIEGMYYISKSGTTAAVGIGFSGGATLTAILYNANSWIGAIGTSSATSQMTMVAASANTNVIATSVTACYVYFKGLIQVNAGGTIIPSVKWSASNTSPTMKAGSFITFTPIGTNTVTKIGNVG